MQAKPIIPPHYLADDVTVGELIRWLNKRLVDACREDNAQEQARRMMELGDGVERAMAEYRNARVTQVPEKEQGFAPICRLCGVAMQAGIAIPPAMTDRGEANYISIPPLTRVWKCPCCGHSFTQHPTIP